MIYYVLYHYTCVNWTYLHLFLFKIIHVHNIDYVRTHIRRQSLPLAVLPLRTLTFLLYILPRSYPPNLSYYSVGNDLIKSSCTALAEQWEFTMTKHFNPNQGGDLPTGQVLLFTSHLHVNV